MIIKDSDIGGGKVLRAFTMGGETLKNGTHLSRDQILAMPYNNRQALIDGGRLAVYPPAPDARFIHHEGFGKFHVVEGRRITDEPVTKEEAERIVAELGSQAEPVVGEPPLN